MVAVDSFPIQYMGVWLIIFSALILGLQLFVFFRDLRAKDQRLNTVILLLSLFLIGACLIRISTWMFIHYRTSYYVLEGEFPIYYPTLASIWATIGYGVGFALVGPLLVIIRIYSNKAGEAIGTRRSAPHTDSSL